jgi:hypothetical protein
MSGLLVLAALAWLVGWLVDHALLLALILLPALAIRHAWLTARAYDREVDLDREAERESLLIRANYENAMYLRGDPVGVYGHYTPPTMPLTRPLLPVEPRDWYDYDDGLTDWRTA